ncbi:hypothetical protein OOZ19_28350 [Saccharopolyspora sp. NFXS83]|uniref:hypothetical protein n=1 Tax=Saccharopolyspora sp. NFXS83 TaxID=2993560 RepID=UPI00224AB47E|nr:hypothetical protein [Saccharopolyspora sp. NFXS83]MCX2734174.1 hypothetical protein [Saccharopolyspora sp. NFXS83]
MIEQPAPGAGPHRIRAVSACTADTGRHDPFDFTGTGALPALRSVVPVSAAEPSRDEPTDDLPGADPFSDTTPVGGLHKFDLGMVPASVTPPRSSRRAAWFAVASSGAAFGGLLLVATALVGPTTSIEGLQLPGMPRATHFPAPAPERVIAGPPSLSEPSPTSAPGHLPQRGGAPLPPPFPHLPPAPADLPAAAAAPPPEASAASAPAPEQSGAAAPPPEHSSTAAAPSPSITYRGELLTLTDPRTVAARSGNYFAAVRGGDLQAAYAMTTGRLRDGGFAAFAAPYRDAASIEVLGVSASSSSTVTTLRITRADGEVSQQQRRLRFTSGYDPRIYADDAAT